MRNFLIVLIGIGIYCYRSPFFHLVDPISYSVSLPAKFEGQLAPNTKLENAEKLFEDQLHWPEAFAVHEDKIYTGLGDGRIVEVSSQRINLITRIGEPCAGQQEEHKCGRPLGMTFTKEGRLYVVDAYLGLFSIDIKTKKKANLLAASTIIDGSPLTLLNNIALDEKDQVLYITQSSAKWNLSHVITSIVEHETTGRLLKYDLKTKKTSVLLKDLSFPNGVELTNDGKALLVAVGGDHKIIKYIIQGSKKGTHSTLPTIFPGELDNISRTKRGTYWVGVENGRTLESLSPLDRVSEYPIVRKIVLYAHRIFATPIAGVMQFLPYDWAKETAFEFHTGRIAADHLKSYGMIIEFDDSGKILQSLHSPSGKVTHISEVLEHNGYLYLGSWRNRYIGRIKL